MNIAILGCGNVGSSLARIWLDAGHEVSFGVRNPNSEKALAAAAYAESAVITSVENAAQEAAVLVLAVPFAAAIETLELAGSLEDKIIIDATNPIGPGLTILQNVHRSGAEELARMAKGAHVVKAFNSVGYEVIRNPGYGEQKAVMHYCGDDLNAMKHVETLIVDAGFDALDAGSLSSARHLEAFALLWIHLSLLGDTGRDFAFGLLRR